MYPIHCIVLEICMLESLANKKALSRLGQSSIDGQFPRAVAALFGEFIMINSGLELTLETTKFESL